MLPAIALYAPEHPALLALPCWVAACLLLARPLARAAIARCREDAHPRLLRPMLVGAALAALILLEQHGAFAPPPAPAAAAAAAARRDELRSVARSIHLALQRGEAEWRARQAERPVARRPEGEKP